MLFYRSEVDEPNNLLNLFAFITGKIGFSIDLKSFVLDHDKIIQLMGQRYFILFKNTSCYNIYCIFIESIFLLES